MIAPAKRNIRLWHWLLGIVLLAGLLTGSVIGLLTTTAGARLLARWAMRLEPRLSLQVTGGSLWRGLQLTQLSWMDESTTLTLDALDTRWQAALAPEPTLRIKQALANGLRIHLQPATPQSDKPAEAVPFRFPFRLEIQDSQLRDISFKRGPLSFELKDVSFAGDAEDRTLNLTSLQLRDDRLGKNLETSGTLTWTNGVVWQLEMKMKAMDGSIFHASIPTNITGNLTTTGKWQGTHWNVVFDIASLSADWKTYPFSVQGQVSGGYGKAWAASGLTLSQQSNTLHIAGSVAEEMELSGQIHLPQPESLIPDLNGTLEGTWRLTGPLQSPEISLSLKARELAYRDLLQIATAHLEAHIRDLARRDSQLELELGSLSRPDQPRLIDRLKLVATGTQARHEITMEAKGPPTALSLALKGERDEPSRLWSGDLQRATISIAEFDWTLIDHLPMCWDPATKQITMAPHRWTHNQAELRATDPLLLGTTGQIQLDLVQLNLTEFQAWLPESFQIKGSLDAATRLQWTNGELKQADASIDIQDGAVRLISPPSELAEETPPVDIIYDTIHLDTKRMSARQWTTRLAAASDHLGSVRAETQLSLTTNRTLGDWTGQIDLESVKLELLKPFIPSLRSLSGQTDASIQLSGNPRHPSLHGTLSITNGLLEPMEWPITLGDIHLSCILQGEQATLTGGFRSGEGLASLSGQLNITDNAWDATVQLSGDKLDLSYDSFVVFQATPDLTLHVAPKRLTLDGNILIPKADITIQELPDTAVRPSPDVRIIQGGSEEETPPAGRSPSDWERRIRLDLQLGDEVLLSGYGITSHLEGHLRIDQTGMAAPSANGEIRLAQGNFKALGQDLQIRTGQFLFAGPLNRPTLYVEAVREVTDYMVVAGIRVEGPMDSLQTTLFSQPSLPQDEILPYLLLGRPLERGDSGASDGMLANAALSLGISGGRGHMTSLAERMGIENFTIGAEGGGTNTELVVSGQVSERLQVSYGSSVFANGTTLTLRYRLAPRLFLETVSGLTSSLEFLYSFEY